MKCFTFLFVYLLFMYTSNAQTSKELSEQYENAMTYNLYEDALSTGEKLAQKIANNKATSKEYEKLINELVGISLQVERFKTAQFWAEKTVDLLGRKYGKNSISYAGALHLLGYTFHRQSLCKEAEKLYKESMSIFKNKKIENTDDYATICNNMANVSMQLGKYIEAEFFQKEAINLAEKVHGKEHHVYASYLDALGLIYHYSGRYVEAKKYYQQAISIVEHNEESLYEYSTFINNLAAVHMASGHFVEAELLYKKALDIKKNTIGEYTVSYATSLNNLATLYKKMGQYSAAEEKYKESLAIIDDKYGENHPYYASLLNNLSLVLQFSGRISEAEYLQLEALKLRRRQKDTQPLFYASSLNNLALLYHATGAYEKAKPLYKESADIQLKLKGEQHPDYATSLNNLASIYQYTGLTNESEALFEQVLKIRFSQLGEEHPDYINTLNTLAYFSHKKGEHSKAWKLYDSTFSLYKLLVNKTLPGLSEEEARHYLAEINYNFEMFFSFLKSSSSFDPEIVYNNVLFFKGLPLLLKQKTRPNALSQDPLLNNLWHQYQIQQASLSKWLLLPKQELLDKGIDLKLEKEKIDEIEKKLTKLGNIDFAKRSGSWKEIQGLLKDDEAAIELVRFRWYNNGFTDTIYYAALVIDSKCVKPKMIFLGNGSLIEGDHFSNYHVSHQTKRDSLFKLYWNDIHKEIEGIKKVYLSRDGVYNKINLDALPLEDDISFLSDILQIIPMNSTKDLLETHLYDQKISKSAILVGGVDYGKKNDGGVNEWEYLPNSLDEINKIQKIVDRHQIKPVYIRGLEAREENIKNINNAYVVHLATHGYFIESRYDDIQDFRIKQMYGKLNQTSEKSFNPMLRSGLVLANANRLSSEMGGEDGLLTAYEIAGQMNLRSTALVVLSACDTGKGANQYGEGIYGLQRAFQIAGAHSIIMTLWPVQDQVSEEFFGFFYTNWLDKGMDEQSAFKQAQKLIREDWDNPIHWGAFVFVKL